MVHCVLTPAAARWFTGYRHRLALMRKRARAEAVDLLSVMLETRLSPDARLS